MKPSLTRSEWLSVISGTMIAGLLVVLVVTLVLQGGVVLTNIAELAFVIAGFGSLLGYQLGLSMKRSRGSFLWSMGFTTTILIAFLSIAIVEDASVTLLLVIVLGCSCGGFLTLMLSGEVTKAASLEAFMGRWFRWIAASLLSLHIVVAYLYPSADYVLGQVLEGNITDPNLVTLWFLLLVIVITAMFVVRYFSQKTGPTPVEPGAPAESKTPVKKPRE